MINHRIGVYPGSFDPITTGHIDIITRSQRLVDKLIVGVAINTGKSPLFSYDERMEMLRTELADLPSGDGLAELEVRPIEGLLVQFAKSCDASLI
jgi:pantetheine-phosphate adenylyltransferase